VAPCLRLSSRHTRSSPRRHISAQGDPVPPSGHMGRQPRVWRGFLKARRGKRGGKKRGQRGRKKGTYAWKERGGHVVTIAFCKKRLPKLRDVVDNTVRNALHDAGLAWLRRRLKRFAPRRLHPWQAGAIVPPPSSPRPIYCHRCHRP
jgi:hypothetical protein